MASFDYTVEIERALLKIMTTSQMLCRANLHTLKDELFSSAPRKFILATAQGVFANTRATLSEMVYKYEVGAKIEASQASIYIGEWSLIQAMDA